MKLTAPLGIFGGTFDPIHNGHIYPILEAAKITNIKKVAMMPCYIPSHKNAATVSSQHRLKMIEMVCAQHPLFYPDPRDINRAEPTYSVDSLISFRNEFPTTPLCFFVGSDSLQSLTSWYQWQKIIELCHFVVCTREYPSMKNVTNDNTKQKALFSLLQEKQTQDPKDLHTNLAGKIFLANTQSLTISSSLLRKQLITPLNGDEFIPANVLEYIRQHKLYQLVQDLC